MPTFTIINLAIYLAEKTTTMPILVTSFFPGNYILNARHSHVSQPKAASIGHHEEVWLYCPTHTNTYIHKNIHTHTCIHTYTHTYTKNIHTHIQTHHTNTHTCIHTYMHKHIHTQKHTYTLSHTHIYTYTHLYISFTVTYNTIQYNIYSNKLTQNMTHLHKNENKYMNEIKTKYQHEEIEQQMFRTCDMKVH